MRLIKRLVALAILIPILLFGIWFCWNMVFLDDVYREGMYHSGEMKVVIHEFRSYYHGRSNYPALSVEELRRQGIMSDHVWGYLEERGYTYHPFSSETSRDALVLRLGWPLVGDYFYKRDLVAGLNDPDTILPDKASP